MNETTVGWFEIPVSSMDRAILFYETECCRQTAKATGYRSTQADKFSSQAQ